MSTNSLYLHIPFCKQKCAYCDFTSFATNKRDDILEKYTESIKSQIKLLQSSGFIGQLDTAYIGGGTPSLLGAENLSCIIEQIDANELTFEANPESITVELIKCACEAGATRVSIGIQSLNDDDLKLLGRVHDASNGMRALKIACESPFVISADLICAIPNQSLKTLRANVQSVIDCGVKHVSVYPLMIEEGTKLAKFVDDGMISAPSDDEEATSMIAAESVLVENQFHRYEVASYALSGYECAHNKCYWTGKNYLGIGTSAASMMDIVEYNKLRRVLESLPVANKDAARVRFTCKSSPQQIIDNSLYWEIELLTAREAVAEDLMLACRMQQGISDELLSQAKDIIGDSKVMRALDELIEEGLLTEELKPTHSGWLMGNIIFETLWNLSN